MDSKSENEEKNCWESWLGDEKSKYIIEIREAVKRIHKENADKYGALPFYTPHGPEHCHGVEDIIHRLIPGNTYKDLDEQERFYLLSSAWLHDLGMTKIVAMEVWHEDLSPTEIRKRHHITSAKFITSHYQRCGLKEGDKEFLAQICRYHRKQEDIGSCLETLMVGNKAYKLRLLSSYLRLADALHIDNARTDAPAYAVCLAYDISTEAKYHWIKSRLVNGIKIDPEKHLINIEFKIPINAQSEGIGNEWIRNKINYIIKLVTDDLRDELASVINILTRAGITYYLDINKSEAEVFMDDQMYNDLIELVMNYDIVGAPSASKLLEMILVTISNIAGYHIKKRTKPVSFKTSQLINNEDKKKKIDDFLNRLEIEILERRSCHLGLKQLLVICKNVSKLLPNDMDTFINRIDTLYQNHFEGRNRIRENASLFFNDIYKKNKQELSNIFSDIEQGEDEKPTLNIVLYGYSELVIMALCGFRDSIIKDKLGNTNVDVKEFYNSELEKHITEKIRIFVCEGQPKTQTAPGDRLLYHDGFQYAKALIDKKFKNIIIIPDIVIGNIIEHYNLHLLMVGANGFTNDIFKHSAGHGPIINLIKAYKEQQDRCDKKWPLITLVVNAEKHMELKDMTKEKKGSCVDSTYKVEGYRFWNGVTTLSTRTHVWIIRDSSIYNDINEYSNIMFYNPREDVIAIELLDYVISDLGYYSIYDTEEKKTKGNINTFINRIKQYKEEVDAQQKRRDKVVSHQARNKPSKTIQP